MELVTKDFLLSTLDDRFLAIEKKMDEQLEEYKRYMGICLENYQERISAVIDDLKENQKETRELKNFSDSHYHPQYEAKLGNHEDRISKLEIAKVWKI